MQFFPLFLDADYYYAARWLFLRTLGLIYAVAFASLLFQAKGLIGQNGILPAVRFLNAARRTLGTRAYFQFPTLFWIRPDDKFLSTLCIAGIATAVLVVLGVQTTLVLFCLWLFYLSIVTIGREFLSY